jgi:prepilin-type processing-associated H-X9-DG protein
MKVHYLAVPMVAPAWAVRDGNLYIALYPQMVAAAADHVWAARPSLLDNERFAAMRGTAGDAKVSSFGWVDVPNNVGDGYQSSIMLTRLAAGMADMMGVDAPAMVLPPLHKLRAHLSPVAGFGWSDDKGWHMRSTSPFPGASYLGTPGNAAMSQYMMMAGMMMPAMVSARSTAQATSSLNNMRQIAVAMHTWAQEHDGRLPEKLGPALLEYTGDAHVFVHPQAGGFVPIEPDQAWFDRNADYIYVAGGKKLTDFREGTSNAVMMFEKQRWAQQGMIAVLFVDGHVQRIVIPQADEMLRKQTGKGLNEWDR